MVESPRSTTLGSNSSMDMSGIKSTKPWSPAGNSRGICSEGRNKSPASLQLERSVENRARYVRSSSTDRVKKVSFPAWNFTTCALLLWETPIRLTQSASSHHRLVNCFNMLIDTIPVLKTSQTRKANVTKLVAYAPPLPIIIWKTVRGILSTCNPKRVARLLPCRPLLTIFHALTAGGNSFFSQGLFTWC